MKSKKTALFHSVIALLLCVSMLAGTTFAWFTDEVRSGINTIAAGNLDVELYHSNAKVTDEKVTNGTTLFLDVNGEEILWEPGVVSWENLRISNEGDLALVYQLAINTANENFIVDPDAGTAYGLSQILKVGIVPGGVTATDRASVVASVTEWTTLSAFQRMGSLLPEGKGESETAWGVVIYWQPGEDDNRWNLNNGKTLNEGDTLQIDLGVKLTATQEQFENDSFGKDYDSAAKEVVFPDFVGTTVTAPVTPDADNKTASEVTLAKDQVSAFVPTGVQLKDGVTDLTLSVTELDTTGSNIVLGEGEAIRSLDVHVEGVADNNTAPITVTLKEAAPLGLNMGNYQLYHVENGATNKMTLVASGDAFTAHNQFKYDPATGDLTLYMATFSEVAMTAEEAKWEGALDYSWYVADATELKIANADQLAGFGAIVGGMAKTVADFEGNTVSDVDSFSGKKVTLIADIDLDDGEDGNDPDRIFYPIGYNSNDGKYEKTGVAVNSSLKNFEGTFDGQGHTISNFYQNTWEMKGDHNWYDATLQYYRDGMGLFGRVYGGTVKNLTVNNFKSDGEITTTGCIAAYADGATFENIAITNCNPRVYNIGNGGIVGCVGWYAKEANLETSFTNITVDNSNKISALWGSYDVACGGIVGQYYPTSGQTSAGTPKNGGITLNNCHVAAQMDVYNDVCGNYQYYAYRYAGMLIGSIRENLPADANGHVYPDMTGITATGCTVNYGNWNHYYYCELQTNGKASYTHDHKFSRLTQILSLDEIQSGEVWTKTGNFLYIDANKNTTCYHIREDENGTLYRHEHTDAGTQVVNGATLQVEDHACVYLPFNDQLFTGYGWGVTSKGLEDFEGVENWDVKLGENEASVVKFDSLGAEKLSNGVAVSLGTIFAAKADASPEIVNGKVQVYVSPVNDSTVSAVYTPDNSDWTKGTLTLDGTGTATITITDYYFCTPTTITVTVGDREPVEKFDVKLSNGDFLHRVGNANAVTLSNLFAAKDGASIGTVSVSIETLNGTGASGTYTPSATWTSGSITFSGTGVVKVTITDNDWCTPTELILEVVEATNVTSATDATEENIVLLSNVTGGFEVSNGFAVYGNGFKATCSGDGSYSNSKSLSYAYVTVSKGGILDNVQVICDVYPESYLFTTDMKAVGEKYPYGYSAVIVSGNSTISNCYIYGARNNILVTGGNVRIEDTVTELGSFANIHINGSDSDTVTLHDLTTVQYEATSSYDTSKKVLGFAVVVGTNESTSNAKLILSGELKQYNWVTSDNEDVSNTYAQTALKSALTVTKYQHLINSKTAVNLGIAYLNTKTATIDEEARTNKDSIPYELNNITMAIQSINATGQVFSVYNGGNTSKTVSECYDPEADVIIPYVPSANRTIAPEIVYSSTNSSITFAKPFDSVTQKWMNKLTVDLDTIAGSSYDFYFNSIQVQKYGQNLTFSVTDANGNSVNVDTAITLNALLTNEYTVTATYDSVQYNLSFVLVANRTSLPKPTITYNSTTFTDTTNGRLRLADTKSGDWRPTVNALAGVTITYWSTTQNKEITLDLGTLDLSSNTGTVNSNVWTYTCDDFTLTLTGGEIKTGYNITPIVSAAVDSTKKLYYCSTNVAYGTTSTNDNRTIKIDYVLTANGETATYNRNETVNFSSLAVYDYSKFKDGTLKAASNVCVTRDTLVTMADGSQKRLDEVAYGDEILVWDFYTGKNTVVPASYLVNHGYENNTVIRLTFDDGTTIKAVGRHGFFDVESKEFAIIDEDNVAAYVGHSFTKQDGATTKLVSYSVTKEYIEAWSIMSYKHYNCYLEGILTLTPPEASGNYFMPFEVGEGMKFDEEKMQADIAKYGLYTYAEFAEKMPEELFYALNGPQIKVAVGKGIITQEELDMIIAGLAEKFS